MKTNYSTGEASATVTNGSSVALAIPISQLTSSANITVTDGTNPISGATVNVSVGGATQTATTVGGVATFANLPVGTYTFTATATGYGSGSVSVPVTAAGGSGAIPLVKQTFTITTSAGTGGTIAVSSGTNPLAYGDNVSFTFAPSTGYQVSSVAVDGTTLGATPTSYAFTKVISAHTLDVTFESIPAATIILEKVSHSNGVNDFNGNSYTISYVLHGISFSTTLMGCFMKNQCGGPSVYTTIITADVGSYVTVKLISPNILQTYKFYVHNEDATYELS